MATSRNDSFDINQCMRGLGNLITYMHSDLYEYTYFFTFKKSMKSYVKDFDDPWGQPIEHIDFFEEIEDPFVKNTLKTTIKLINCKRELALRFGIEEIEDLQDEEISIQAKRYEPFCLIFKHSKSYKRLKLYYERTLSSIIDSLYLYACAITIHSYKIPLVLKRRFQFPGEDGLRFLNHDDHNVQLLIELISGLRKDLNELRLLINK